MNLLLSPDNHLFTLARSGKRLPHWLLAVVLSYVFVLVAQLGGSIPAILIILALSFQDRDISFDNSDEVRRLLLPDTALEQVIFLLLIFAPIFLLLWGWLAWYEKRPLWTIGLERRGAALKYLRGLLAGLVMFAVSIGLAAAFGFVAFEEGTSMQSQGWSALGGVLLVFLGWMVQGAAEETLVRGWLLPVIGGRYKPLWGILISSLTFAVYHSINPNLGLIAVLNLFLFGILTAFYALYEGGLWGVFGLHTAWNWAQGHLFGFQVSGLPPAGGTLFNLMEVGPDAVTGGPFGPEGGLAVTVVLLLSSGLVWWVSERKPPVTYD
jgi:membrane protease YdiL (CAAX protease family)